MVLINQFRGGSGMYSSLRPFFHSVRCRVLVAVAVLMAAGAAGAMDPQQIVREAINHWRGAASASEMTMTIHRADWERSMTFQSWTQGLDASLVRVIAPQKDLGNGTLTVDNSMWSYSPKINRVIKVPSSMMNQSWMGSDFSNKDVSRADDIVELYTHRLLETREQDGWRVYVIEALPLEAAAVAWGREVLHIREDLLLLEQRYYDQDGVLVKKLEALEIGPMGGRTLALRQRMSKADNPAEWTEMRMQSMSYDIQPDSSLFTLASLRNPRN
jgi:outer membrane lipoprotein-sorting protein